MDERRFDRWTLAVVMLAAACVVGSAFARFWPNADHIFWDMTHDRNAHYYQGLSMALNARGGDLAGLARDIDSCRIWGILHPVLIAVVELVAGPNVRLGVLPSTLGWFGAAVFAFLLGRRVCDKGGTWAGAFAAALVLASPAHQAYATDIMLESSGACLTLATLYAYLVWAQGPSRRAATWLAVSWSLLFFDKYNYWLLVSAAMILNETLRNRQLAFAALSWCRVHALSWLIARLKSPFTLLAIALAVAGLAIAATGGTTLSFRGRDVSLRNPHNLIQIAYLIVFVQLLLWWMRTGKQAIAALPDAYRPLVYGHLVPILVWFTLPKRLFNFFWFLSPANADHANHGFLPGLRPYWAALQADYHADPLWLLLAVGLFAVAVVSVRNLRPGSAALLWMVAISAFLTMQHPMAKNRFLHSWVACLWVAAGIGLIEGIRILLKPWPTAARWSGAVAVLTCVALLGPAFFAPGHAHESGIRLDRPSTLTLARQYLPELKHARNVTILSNVQTAFEQRWTYLEEFRRTRGLATEIKGYDPKVVGSEKILSEWLASTNSDAIVVIDIPPESPLFQKSPLNLDVQPIVRTLEAQSAFTATHHWRLEHGETIQIWTRTAAVARR